MAGRSLVPRLSDMVQACERIRTLLHDMSLEAFEADWQKQWLVERGIEIISEASRHLTDELKARHPSIPWVKVAGIGNVLRHNYEHVVSGHPLEACSIRSSRTRKSLPRRAGRSNAANEFT